MYRFSGVHIFGTFAIFYYITFAVFCQFLRTFLLNLICKYFFAKPIHLMNAEGIFMNIKNKVSRNICGIIAVLLCMCITLVGCSEVEYPELSESDKEICLQSLAQFQNAANNLNGEELQSFCDSDYTMYMSNAALIQNEGKLTKEQESAFYTVVIVNNLLPKDFELTDAEIQKMRLTVNKDSMRGYMDTAVFIDGSMYFEEDKSDARNIEICMYIGQNSIYNSKFEAKIQYIKFKD